MTLEMEVSSGKRKADLPCDPGEGLPLSDDNQTHMGPSVCLLTV